MDDRERERAQLGLYSGTLGAAQERLPGAFTG